MTPLILVFTLVILQSHLVFCEIDFLDDDDLLLEQELMELNQLMEEAPLSLFNV